MKKMWQSPDLAGTLRLFALNHEALEAFDRGWMKIASPFQRLMHLARRNTARGSVRNIHSHYDLGNEFFSLFLDPTMTYSCALFMDRSMTLEEAQMAKIERICRKLSLERRHRILEIGGGWGSFALHAARAYGCTVTALTLSREQFEYMCRQVREAGLEEKVTVLLEDYRAIRGCYDRIVSIEMIEAIGYQQLDEFFRRTSSLLTSDGLMAIQAITMLDSRFEEQKASVDFIKLHIFPGSCLVSLAALQHSVAGHTDLRLIHLEDITPHYAATLRIWRERLLAQRELLIDRGFTDEFIRKWEFYFSFCEAGFAERCIGDVQIVYAKPMSRQEPLLGDV